MSEPDEYDEYYFPLTPEDILAIEAITAHAIARNKDIQIESSYAPSPPPLLIVPTSPPSPDEFDAYDFSEFTADDFENIDKMVLASVSPSNLPDVAQETYPSPSTSTRAGTGRRRTGDEPKLGRDGGGGPTHGGPRIQITLEGAKNANPSRYIKGPRGKRPQRSPYELFRKWNHLLSVTDLASPSWCEVQFDYGLRQKRSRKLVDRPTSFVSAEGKTITVAQSVAAVNERTVTRGKSVHKVLEREIQPEEVQVEVATAEERWALRLVNMITSFQMLMEQGRCREMPVFGIVHDQLVTGIIDEVVRKPTYDSDPSSKPVLTKSSPNKRAAPPTAPSTPSHRRFPKKNRQETQLDQPITAFFSPSRPHVEDGENACVEGPHTPLRPEAQLSAEDESHQSSHMEYSLHLSDTKTRRRPSLPPDEDIFASRIQLMLYHRLLSAILSSNESASPSSHSFNFEEIWQKADVNPTLKLSDKFLLQTGLSAADGEKVHQPSCLADLTLEWQHVVNALGATSIDKTLTLVYRIQPRLRRFKGKEKPSTLSDQEAVDLAAAVQASINEVQPDSSSAYEADLARAISESLKDAVLSGNVSDGDLGILTNPFGPPISAAPGMSRLEGEMVSKPLAAEPELAWALQQSLLPQLEETPALREAVLEAATGEGDRSAGRETSSAEPTKAEEVVEIDDDGKDKSEVASGGKVPAKDVPDTRPSSPIDGEGSQEEEEETLTLAELEKEARILGTKEFDMDDAFLDGYLAQVLAWWHGQRAPRGVDVELTRRCITCEYREGCEWREMKAQEALDRYKRSRGETTPGAVEVWL